MILEVGLGLVIDGCEAERRQGDRQDVNKETPEHQGEARVDDRRDGSTT